MTPESTGSALKSTERWEASPPLVRNIEDSEPKETETTKEDLLTKPTTREETKSDSEDTDNKSLFINVFNFYVFYIFNEYARTTHCTEIEFRCFK